MQLLNKGPEPFNQTNQITIQTTRVARLKALTRIIRVIPLWGRIARQTLILKQIIRRRARGAITRLRAPASVALKTALTTGVAAAIPVIPNRRARTIATTIEQKISAIAGSAIHLLHAGGAAQIALAARVISRIHEIRRRAAVIKRSKNTQVRKTLEL